MKKGTISRIVHEPGQPLPETGTDWDRVNAMTNEEVLAAALSDPDAQPLHAGDMAKMERIPNVRRLRERLGLTSEEFARAYHLPLETVLAWEERRRFLDPPARALLRVIERDPEGARRALATAAE